MGAHLASYKGKKGVHFAVWAPNAERVSVICDSNGWREDVNPLVLREDTGVWQGFIEGIREGECYKYAIKPKNSGEFKRKADPYAFATQERSLSMDSYELSKRSASVVCNLSKFEWTDGEWIQKRKEGDIRNKPVNIYECNLGSWKRKDNNQ